MIGVTLHIALMRGKGLASLLYKAADELGIKR